MGQLKDTILQTSLELFDKYGYHGVAVNQIVEASGTSKGGFYHHFQSKDELLYVIHDQFITYALEKATYAVQHYESPPKRLEEVVRSFVKVFDIYKPYISVFYQESTYLKPPYDHKIKQKRAAFKQIIFQVVEEGKQSGDFRSELPVEITGMAILGMVNWTYKWYQKDGEKTIEEIADIFANIILHAVLYDTRQNVKRTSNEALFFTKQK
ncbi:TetR/AcrR family transcriptional regulator [Aquibacillus sp. 3ASR75-11]|uniref:TetR/AcrR family transcriptional regulator n=1 Tax=Terrihalobacillus insolitus TaxID=2950438 RepID=A0A9X3WUL6_9BACI|nr:TetR/AcrR family transcriptional regulator [Terrihalobacillus insolitus]MDC3425910.1 TetR/AcrR family transcriptional regulator [Terrihalobacillus insolitus]